jgi:hypothetical protein
MDTSAMYGEAVAGRAALVRKQLLHMASNMAISTFDMIELLTEAQEQQYPLRWGFSSLPDYGAMELGIKPRKTQYLARIGKVTKQVGLKRAQYEGAGISKLREIVTLDPEGSYWNPETHSNEDLDEHIVRLILDSDKMTVDQVKLEVCKLKGQTGKDKRVIRSYSTDITTWQNVIDPAIELARRLLGSKGRDSEGAALEYSEGECYECICASFLADLNNQPEPVELPTEERENAVKLPMENI